MTADMLAPRMMRVAILALWVKALLIAFLIAVLALNFLKYPAARGIIALVIGVGAMIAFLEIAACLALAKAKRWAYYYSLITLSFAVLRVISSFLRRPSHTNLVFLLGVSAFSIAVLYMIISTKSRLWIFRNKRT